MIANLSPAPLFGTVQAPPSKSCAQRALLAAFLSGEKTSLGALGDSADIRAMKNALMSLGAEITMENGGWTVQRKQELSCGVTLNCGESATALRFLLPVVCALGVKAEFTGEESLLRRPVSALKEVLSLHGVCFNGNAVSGKLSSGVYRIRADISSQYLSGLLFALPLLSGDSEIIFEGKAVSKHYLALTEQTLENFGVRVERKNAGYRVFGGQRYRLLKDWTIEGDYSSAAFFLAAGGIGGEVTVGNLPKDSLQGDRKILSLLKEFGAEVMVNRDAVTVKKGALKGICIDCEDIPDLVPILSVLAAFAHGTTRLTGVERLKIKESDRIVGIEKMLQTAGIKVLYQDGVLIVQGGAPRGGTFSTNDHRIAMAAAVLACCACGNSQIQGAESVEKSYPSFWEDFKKVKGAVHVGI